MGNFLPCCNREKLHEVKKMILKPVDPAIDLSHSSIITVHSGINKQNNIHWKERFQERHPDHINLFENKTYKNELLKKLSSQLNVNKKKLEEANDGRY